MKKFIIPEVNSVELTQTDVIMDSNNAGTAFNADNYAAATSTLTKEYAMWEGFGD